MKAIFIFLLSTVIGACSLSAQNAPVRKVWDKTFGGDGSDLFYTMLPTADGGYLLGGTSSSNKSGDKSEESKGGNDFWIVKMDANGNRVWDKSFGGKDEDRLRAMLPTGDGGFLLGGYSNSNKGGDKSEDNKGGYDFWIVKIDTQGNKLWDKTFGGNSTDQLFAIVPTVEGGYLLGGASASSKGGDKTEDNHFGKILNDGWVVKIDAQGNKQWDKTIGGDSGDFIHSILPTPDNGYLLGGETGDPFKGLTDYWLVKIDAQGNKLWDKTFNGSIGESSWDFINAILPTDSVGYILAGIKGASDYWIIKVDSQGNKLWDKTFNGYRIDYLIDLVFIADGGFLLGGWSDSNKGIDKSEDSKGNRDYWIIKIDSIGNKLWDKTLGGNNDEQLSIIVPTTDDGSFLLGGWSESNKGGDKSEDCRGLSDFWIIKIAIEPNGITETTETKNGPKVYPNPSDGTITISHPDNYTLDLFDAKGSLLRTLPMQGSSTELTGLASGLYLLRLTTVSGKTLTQKIVVN